MTELWRRLTEHEPYSSHTAGSFAAGAAEQYKLALRNPVGVGAALRALRELPAEVSLELLPELYDVATSPSSWVGLAREVVAPATGRGS